jgi:predicted alpha-1,2-mannosidase
MKRYLLNILLLSAASAGAVSPIDLVDTRVGTAFATTATAGLFGKGSEEHGQTLPAVGVPNGMTLWTPQTRDTELKCIAPYYYPDSLLQGFRNSHWVNGGCTQDYGSMTLHAMSGNLRTTPAARASRIDRESECARPDYYSVYLPDEGVKAEMTGLSRSGIFRFTYTEPGVAHLVVNPNSDEGVGTIEYDPISHEIRGSNPIHRIYQGWGEPTSHSGWFVVKLPAELQITDYGTFCGDTISSKSLSVSGKPGIGVYISFNVSPDNPVVITAGSSFTSAEGAKRNLDAEIPSADFEKVRSVSCEAWGKRLGLIRVEGGSDTDRRKFYGSLYRSSLLPRVISDVDGAYPKFASGKEIMHTPDGRDMYDDFSMWDTYRALHPLLTLIDPQRSGDMMQSLVRKAEEGGWMPIFPCWNSYTAAMIGDHCAAAIADAAVKGVDNFDLPAAYRYLRQNAFESPATFAEYKDGMGRRALKSYLKYGYIPLEDGVEEAFHKQEQTSRTLEYAFDDFALSQIASMLGNKEDAEELSRRSGNYRNVIDPALGYANGRHEDGSFETGTDPFDFNRAITEGAPCHYTWYVPHDPDGLIEALGGREIYVARLDSMFTHGRYWHGNEPCHQVPYMFNFAGRHDLTRKWTRHILDTEYLNEPGGLSGNDDAGQMSAWFVFSAMGLYPVCPATEYYELGYPLFDRITITPEGGGEFVITASPSTPSSGDGLMLNGERLTQPRISHSELKRGGSLKFE